MEFNEDELTDNERLGINELTDNELLEVNDAQELEKHYNNASRYSQCS